MTDRPTSRRDGRLAPRDVRLVATDLDGTLVRSDGTVSPRTRDALARLEESGRTVVMVTGRPPRWMDELADVVGRHGLAVCANGAVLYDLHAGRVLAEEPLAAHDAAQVLAALTADLPGLTIAAERAGQADPSTSFVREHAYRPRWAPKSDQVADREELIASGVVKLLVRVEGVGSDELLARARAILGGSATVTHSSTDGLLEIAAAGVSKASGLARFAEQRGFTAADTVAFGDMPNDLPQLEWAGWSVAVANAHPVVLAAVDEVTTANDEDGVARVVERWLG